MDKPIVFFSHSTKDELELIALKELLLAKTGNVLDIFLSSDGQSIPFGRNWVYSVQENLNKSSIMFVFISPNSLNSNWLYFESGYAYSKSIRVVPIGILGVNLNQIKPPLSLLQGFNLNDAESIKNLIAIINEEYSTNFSLEISDKEYHDIFNPHHSIEIIQEIRSIIFDVELLDYPLIENIKTLFIDNELEFVEIDDRQILTRGIWILYSIHPSTKEASYRIQIDHNLLLIFLDPVMNLIPLDDPMKCTSFRTRLEFDTDYTINWHSATRAGKLYGTKIILKGENTYSFEGKIFEFNYGQIGDNSWEINFDSVVIREKINYKWIMNLAQILINNEVVYKPMGQN